MQPVNPIPIVDFGGAGPSLHFAHANAYPPRCYEPFLAPLTADFQVWAMEQRPLWTAQPVQWLDGWRLFCGDLIRALEQQGAGPVIGVGHSLGAVVSMMAAEDRPELFKALVLIEPVLLPPALLQAAREHPEQAESIPLVQRARNRRHRWPSRRHAFDRFRGKSVFSRLSDEALWAYANHGLTETADGRVQLRFPREWEAQIYGQPPVDIWEVVPQLRLPTLALRGEHSDTIAPASWRRWQALQPDARFVEVEGTGHLAPLEKPVEVGGVIRDFLNGVIGAGLWKDSG